MVKMMTMPALHVGQGATAGPLTVFPVWAAEPGPAGLATGLAADVRVGERDGRPVVGQLVLTNTGSAPALLVEGELLEGGWQHRVLLHDLVLAPGRSMVAPVACVEAGRWGGGGQHARRARRASGAVRATLHTTSPSMRQGEVWRRVSGYDTAMGASATSSFLDHLDAFDSDRAAPSLDSRRPPAPGGPAAGPSPAEVDGWLREVRAVAPLDGQRGVVVGVAGQPVLLEVFPSSQALTEALPALLTGLLLDAVAAGAPVEPTPARRARRIVERLDGERFHRQEGVDAGLGVPQTLDTRSLAARGVAVDEVWAHLSVFNRTHPLLAAA